MDVAKLVERYEAVSQEDEAELLKSLTENGWEAGCWLRPPAEQIINATQQEVADFLEKLSSREKVQREPIDDPFPNGLPQTAIAGEDLCFIILTQRCDIVAPLKAEPLVELAPAALCKDKQRIDNTWRNSPREFPIDPTADGTFLIDLRYRFFISKLDLADVEPTQALPEDEPQYKVRQRFVLRTGQRYTRAAVPDKLVAAVVVPLARIVKGDDKANALFTEWSLFHGGKRDEKPGVQAVYQLDVDETLGADEQAEAEQAQREQAEDKFQAIIDALPEEAKAELDLEDDHRTQAIPETELTVALWRLSWKLEWDEVSFGGNADAALPAR